VYTGEYQKQGKTGLLHSKGNCNGKIFEISIFHPAKIFFINDKNKFVLKCAIISSFGDALLIFAIELLPDYK